MARYALDRFVADQPNLYGPQFVPHCALACDATVGDTTDFEASIRLTARSAEITEPWSLIHDAPWVSAADLDRLRTSLQIENVREYGAVCVVVSILRARDSIRVREVTERGSFCDYYLEHDDGRSAGVIEIGGTGKKLFTERTAEKTEQVRKAVGTPKRIGVVAFGGLRAAIWRVD